MVTQQHGRLRRVLFVQYVFYPLFNVAVKQAAKLCKFLPEFGWEPVILTKDWRRAHAPEDGFFGGHDEPDRIARDIGYEPRVEYAPYRTRDNALLRAHAWLRRRTDTGAGIGPVGALVRRALSAGYAMYGRYPDEYVGWVAPATHAGVRAASAHGVHAILSSCPPTTGHLVGSAIARRTGLPWVALFGDLFGFYVGTGDLYTTAWRRRVASGLNRRWMMPATRVAAVSPAMVAYLERTYAVPGDVVVVGFDPDESRAGGPSGPRPRLRIVYTGSIYPGDQRPEILFDALDALLARRPDADTALEVVFVGTRCEAELRAMLAGRAAARVCDVRDRVSPDEAIALQASADVLLILNLTNVTAANGTLSYPSKVFEYLNARRPILALPMDRGGWVTRVLADTRSGVSLSTADAAAAQLERWLDEWGATGGVAFAGDGAAIERFSYRTQTATLARLLDDAVAVRQPARRRPIRALRTAWGEAR